MEMKIPQNSGMELNRGKKREVGFNGGNGEMGVVFFLGGFGLCEVEEEGSGLEIGKRKVWFWSDQY